jgi:hypothetical protein
MRPGSSEPNGTSEVRGPRVMLGPNRLPAGTWTMIAYVTKHPVLTYYSLTFR